MCTTAPHVASALPVCPPPGQGGRLHGPGPGPGARADVGSPDTGWDVTAGTLPTPHR
ncbi:hypothetical protein ACFQ6N_00250 [Kitasatospora sp. NPDC056446]|uniref:hypothetical protein n=1 Tax=Kitasatospora sp. NPDC056446 TaxID=3345819 RepID=UPI0036A84340